MTRLGADLRAFGAAAFKELRITRRYPAMYLGMIFWPVLLPAVWVLMGQAYSGGGSTYVLPSGYSNAWASSNGQVILSNVTNFDPNTVGTATWTPLNPAR